MCVGEVALSSNLGKIKSETVGFFANLFGQASKSTEDYFNRDITNTKKGKYDQVITSKMR